MKAIILAAGSGKRLQPYSNKSPKSMIKLGKKSFLERQLNTLKNFGVKNPLVVTGYKSEKINLIHDNTILNKNYENTNMLYSLMLAKDEILAGQDIIISYGDIIYNIELLEILFSSKDDINLISDKNWEYYWSFRTDDPLMDVETFSYDEKKILLDIGRKPTNLKDIKGQYIGLFKISNKYAKLFCHYAELLKYKNIKFRDKYFDKMYMTDFLQYLINNSCKIKVCETYNAWLELDTVHDLKLYKKMIENKSIEKEFKILL